MSTETDTGTVAETNAIDAPNQNDQGTAEAPGDIPLEEMQAPEKSTPGPVADKTAVDVESVFDVPLPLLRYVGFA